MECLAARLAQALAAASGGASSGSGGGDGGGGQELLPSDVAGAVWGMAHVPGYECERSLMQALLAVARPPQQQQPQLQQPQAAAEQGQTGGRQGVPAPLLSGSELAMLAAGVTGQGLPLPGWLSAAALSLLRACARSLEPRDLQRLLLAAATQAAAQPRQAQRQWQHVAPLSGGGGGGGGSEELCAAAARACLSRLQDFSSEALGAFVDQLDALGARGACGELFDSAAALLVKRRAAAAAAAAGATGVPLARGRRAQREAGGAADGAAAALPALLPPPARPSQRCQPGPRCASASSKVASVAAAAVASGYTALARHDPALCVLLLAGRHRLGGGSGAAAGGAAANRTGEMPSLGGVAPAFAG
jgi:hypothetical protein